MPGEHRPASWLEVIRAGEAFHASVSREPRPDFLDRRTHRWAIADRVAWDELPFRPYVDIPHVAALAAARKPIAAASQIVHGDLSGNVLLADGQPPAIIDLTAYWRPPPYASAIVVADGLVWEGAADALLDTASDVVEFGQYLIRALIFRLLSDPPVAEGTAGAGEVDHPYSAAVEAALQMAT